MPLTEEETAEKERLLQEVYFHCLQYNVMINVYCRGFLIGVEEISICLLECVENMGEMI